MLKKTIKYTNFDGVEKTRDFYFHISKAELSKLEMEFGSREGMQKSLQDLVGSGDAEKIIAFFERFILMSYGIRSDDGESFVKTPAMTEAFSNTAAYSELFYELCTSAIAAAEFVSGILPADISGKLQDNELMKMMKGETEEKQIQKPVFDLAPLPSEPIKVDPESEPIKVDPESDKTPNTVQADPDPDPEPENKPWTIKELAELPDDRFKALMQQYAGKTVPKILLQAAMQRF